MDNDNTQTLMIFMAAGLLAVAAFVLVLGLLSVIVPEENPVHARLRALKSRDEIGGAKDRDLILETLIKLVEPISRSFYSNNYSHQIQIKALLTEAGKSDSDKAVWRFLAIQIATGLVIGIVLAGIAFLLSLTTMGFAQALIWGFVGLFGGVVVGRYIPPLGLKLEAGKRKTEIRYTLPDTLDLMVVCVEAGLGLDSTIQRVGEETKRMAPDISLEFQRVTKELNAGISRSEAFSNLGTRAGVDELNSLCNMIVQADKLGTSIAEALRIYADDVRTRRRQAAEELASKASIKMTFPLVLFIFPPLFIVLMGPMVITAMGTFFGGK